MRIGERELLSFASNDYLDLAHDPRLAQAAARAAKKFGTGAGASPLICGYRTPQRKLERELAEWLHCESALVFSSGFAANLAVIAALAGREDAIFSDELNHASVIDGCRLSRANVQVYRHVDLNHLEDLLRRSTARRRFIVTDTVFSMDGDLSPLAELIAFAEKFDCMLIIDEAHATGVLGATGGGLLETIEPRYDPDRLVKIGTLSKALGCQGGFVCGTRQAIDYLTNTARSFIFSTAIAPPIAAVAREAIGIARTATDRRSHLQHLIHEWQPSHPTPIVPVIIGDSSDTLRLSRELRRRGFFVPAVRPPTVPDGTARLRISFSAGHTIEDVRALRLALEDARRSCERT